MYRKKEIAKRLASQLRVTPAMAADQVDRAIAEVLRRIRRGEKARLPGVGILGRDDREGAVEQRRKRRKS